MLEVLVSRIKQYNQFNLFNQICSLGEIYQTTKHIYTDKQGPSKNESLLSDFLMTNKLNVWGKLFLKLLDLDVRDYSIYGRLMQGVTDSKFTINI